MSVNFIILLVILVIIIVIVYLKFIKKKPKSLLEELEAMKGYKELKDLHDVQQKFMASKGTDLDVMPEGIGEFGLEVTNPIPTSTIFGSITYLGSLRTLDGVKVGYDRIGSMGAANIPNLIDAYKITKDGNLIATLYLCPYNKKTSEKAPKGFNLIKLNFENKLIETMPQSIDLKSSYEPTEFVKQIYEIQHNRLLTWRNRYSKEEYPYKVALNTAYQLLTCELMWKAIIKKFTENKSYDQFSEAYSHIQKRSGEIAKEHIHPILESKYKTIPKITILDMNSFRSMVIKAQHGDNGKVKEVERAYIWYTGAVELIYGWVALGLTGKDIQQAVMEMCGILIGGNYSDINVAITNFGQIIDSCNTPLSELW